MGANGTHQTRIQTVHTLKRYAMKMGLLFHYYIDLFIHTICTIFEDTNSSIPASLRQDIGDLLSCLAIQSELGHPFNGGNMGDVSNETILAWIGATESRNSTTHKNLQQLQQQFIANTSDQACGFHFLLLLAFLTILFVLSFFSHIQLWINWGWTNSPQLSHTLKLSPLISHRHQFWPHSFQRSTTQLALHLTTCRPHHCSPLLKRLICLQFAIWMSQPWTKPMEYGRPSHRSRVVRCRSFMTSIVQNCARNLQIQCGTVSRMQYPIVSASTCGCKTSSAGMRISSLHFSHWLWIKFCQRRSKREVRICKECGNLWRPSPRWRRTLWGKNNTPST